MLSPKLIIVAASGLGFLSVALGAFGAHAFKAYLISHQHLGKYETAVQYQMYHALALLLVGILAMHLPKTDFSWIAILFLVGVFIFSGSLYVLCATGIRWMGAITPVGGTCFLLGWGLLAWKVWKGTH